MKEDCGKYALLLVAVPLLLVMTGCAGIVRENILSSVNTAVGVTVAENPQTQLYEAKAGYIRSQFYSIPTGKMILYSTIATNLTTDSAGHTATNFIQAVHPLTTNAADITPQLISGIKVTTKAEQLLIGVDIAESFVVGSEAMKSPAAAAMFISQAEGNGTNATSAASAVANMMTNKTADTATIPK